MVRNWLLHLHFRAEWRRLAVGGRPHSPTRASAGEVEVAGRREQEQQILPAVDLDVSPKWEINFGVGVGVTRSTDHLLIKTIIGYRFSDWPWVRRPTAQVP